MARLYNTKQKQLILEVLNNNKNKCFTVKEISEKLLNYDIKVGTTTIYRFLDELVNKGRVSKIFDDETKSTLYRYLELDDGHWHLRCYKCGELIHLDCRQLNELMIHIKKEHNFVIDNTRLIIDGICQKCSERK